MTSVVDITEISAIVAAVGVLIGVVYYILDLRHQAKSRQTDLVMRLYATFGSKEFQDSWIRLEALGCKDYNECVKKGGLSDYVQCAVFYEGIGVLLQKRLIDAPLVDALFNVPLKFMYEGMKPIIEGNREMFHDPRVFEWFEYLYSEIQKREQQLASKKEK